MRTRRASALTVLLGPWPLKGGRTGAPAGRTQLSSAFHLESVLAAMSRRRAISRSDSVVPSTCRRASAFSAATSAWLRRRRSVPAKLRIHRGGGTCTSAARAVSGGSAVTVSNGAASLASASAASGGSDVGGPALPFGRAAVSASTRLTGNPRKEKPPRRGSSGGSGLVADARRSAGLAGRGGGRKTNRPLLRR